MKAKEALEQIRTMLGMRPDAPAEAVVEDLRGYCSATRALWKIQRKLYGAVGPGSPEEAAEFVATMIDAVRSDLQRLGVALTLDAIRRYPDIRGAELMVYREAERRAHDDALRRRAMLTALGAATTDPLPF